MGRFKKNEGPMTLVVDDDPVYLSFWRRVLTDMGIEDFKLVDDPIVALEMMKQRECCLLISDVIMPHMKGYELAEYAKKLYPDCRIILTTAYCADLSRFNIKNKKFHLLHKPYSNLDELRKFLNHVVAGDSSYDDISEDSFSENDDFPEVLEWKL